MDRHMDSDNRQPLLVILGPTASGKTSFAANIAFHCRGEIISADSRQVYREMDIGTGKDIHDYQIHGAFISFHLIDIADAGQKYNLFEYQQDFYQAYTEISGRGRLPVLCGGSGLYLEAILKGYRLVQVPVNPGLRKSLENKGMDELGQILASYRPLHNTTDILERKRLIRAIEIEKYQSENILPDQGIPALQPLVIGIKYELGERRSRITARLHERLKQGMVEEVERLMHKGLSTDQLSYYGLEYKFITMYLTGEIAYDEMVRQLNIAIHQFAKRQMTWFRKMEREGTGILWLKGETPLQDNLQRVFTQMNLYSIYRNFLPGTPGNEP